MESKGYVCVKPVKHIATEIAIIADMLGFKNLIPEDQLHATLAYGDIGSDEMAEALLRPSAVYKAVPTHFGFLGEGEDRAVVMFLESDDLQKRAKELEESLGSQYDEYVPHISLKYGVTEEDEEITTRASKIIHMVLRTVYLTGERSWI